MRSLTLSLMLLALVTFPTTVNAQSMDQDMIPSSAIAAIFLRPKDAAQQPSMELFPREIASAAGKQYLGFDPMEIVSATVLIDNFDNLDNPPGFAMIVRFDSPQALSENITGEMEQDVLNGKTVYRIGGDSEPVVYVPDGKTMVFGMEGFIKKMLAARGAQSELISLIAHRQETELAHARAFFVMEPVRGLIKQTLPPAEQVPPPFQAFLEIPDLVRNVVVEVDFGGNTWSQLTVGAMDDAAAQRMVAIMKDGIATGRDMLLGMAAQQIYNESQEMQDAVQQYGKRVAQYLENNLIPPASGSELVYRTEGQSQVASISTIGVLVGMLLPAVQQVREAARRTSAMNNLKQIVLAAHNFHDANKRFPGNIISADGTPLLSWRVAILPFIEEGHLYDQFHLDEPWDSEHNIQLLQQMPQIYQSPNVDLFDRTVFLGFEGPGTMFDGGKLSFRDVTDGTSHTLMCVEADEWAAIEWSRPADLLFDPDNPAQGVGNLRPNGFNAAMCDGSVRFISIMIDDETLKWLILRNDGNRVPEFD